jgi:hypothetical protein
MPIEICDSSCENYCDHKLISLKTGTAINYAVPAHKTAGHSAYWQQCYFRIKLPILRLN